MIITLIAGPLIGALVGYCTNFIAIKMMFRPKKPVMIGTHRVPFTPGLIPKRKNDLAKAIGDAVGQVLLTEKDLEESIPKDRLKRAISQTLWEEIEHLKEKEETIRGTVTTYTGEGTYNNLKARVEDLLTEKILDGLSRMDMEEIIIREGTEVILEKVKGTMMAIMINEKMIKSLAAPIGQHIQEYIEDQGEEKVRHIVKEEIEIIEDSTVKSIAINITTSREEIDQLVERLYERWIDRHIGKMLKTIDVSGIVTENVEKMNVDNLEKLILSVMDKELKAIVNLGALLGFFIGGLNILIGFFANMTM
ncbi:MAG: DUF445 family protein [Anaerovoracaceae bacterium]